MTKSKSAAPHGMNTISPHLVVKGAAEAIDFYKKAFDGTEMIRMHSPDGKVMHASMCINDSSVMLMDEYLEHSARSPVTIGGSPVTMHMFVDDVDAVFAQAVAAGATSVMPPDDMFWGDRYSVVRDPFGHNWSIATHLRDMTADEIQAAMNGMKKAAG